MIRDIKRATPYGDVLEDDLHLKNPKTFHYIVQQLASVSFYDCSFDSKGAAFEYYVRATLKGKRLGQYFTPRPLVELMLHVVGREKILNAVLGGRRDFNFKVLDPACGTGGFIVYLMQENLRQLEERYLRRDIDRTTREAVSERIMKDTFYGSDANEGVAAAAKMNMIIAGDGHSNIRAEDSLSAAAKNWDVRAADCNLVLTNPPFGTSEADSLTNKDLEQFPIRTAKGQYLFLEKMVLCTIPGGEICTVIDDGVLNTESGTELRRWLFRMCEVLAVVKLPDETFKPNKITVKSSVLYLRRREHEDVDLDNDYPVTFCEVDSLGYVGSGEPIRGFTFGRMLEEISTRILAHANGVRTGYYWRAFDVSAQTVLAEPSCRIDKKFWEPEVRDKVAILRAAGAPSIAELNRITTARGKSPAAATYVDRTDGHALVIKAGSNISKFGRLLVRGDFIEKNQFDEIESRHLVVGDVLLASTGDGTLGKCCVYRGEVPAIVDGHVTIIRVDPAVVYPEYLADYLRCGFGAQQIKSLYTGSTGLIELTPNNVDVIAVDLLSGPGEQRQLSEDLRLREKAYAEAVRNAEDELREARNGFRDLTAAAMVTAGSEPDV